MEPAPALTRVLGPSPPRAHRPANVARAHRQWGTIRPLSRARTDDPGQQYELVDLAGRRLLLLALDVLPGGRVHETALVTLSAVDATGDDEDDCASRAELWRPDEID